MKPSFIYIISDSNSNLKDRIFQVVINFFAKVLLMLLFLSSTAYSQLKVGSKAPKINITNWVDKIPKESTIENKFIVLEFWATWCAPCLASLPHMNGLQRSFKDRQDLVFLSLTDERVEKVKCILPRFDFESFVVLDTSAMTHKLYEVNSLPATFLIDNRGFVKWSGNPQDLTSDLLNSFLEGKTPLSKTKTPNQSYLILDSLNKEYRIVFNNPEIKSFFSSTKPGLYFSSKSLSYIGTNFYNAYQLGIGISDLLSDLLHCNKSQLQLPDSLLNRSISYCFKQDGLSNKEEGKQLLLRHVLQKLNLKCKIINELQDVFVISVINVQKFQKAIAKEDGQGGVSVSDDSKIIAVRNSPLESLKNEMMKTLDIQVEIKGESKLTGRYDITLDNGSFKDLQKSMNYYGLEVRKEKKKLKKYIIQ